MDQTRMSTPGPVVPGPGPQSQGPGWAPPPGAPGPGRRYRYRSLFWPIILIAAGVIWLLFSLDVISSSNLAVLGLVWPVFVIGIGVDLLVGHRSPLAGAIIAIVTVAVVVVLMAVGPGAGWVGSSDLKTETFSTPVGEATQAEVGVDLSGYAGSIHALPASTDPQRDLVYAQITHRGTARFTAEGTTTKIVTLETDRGLRWWQQIGADSVTPWDIGLDPAIPVAVRISGSSGSSTVDMSGMKQLRALEVQSSSGDSEVTLPPADPLSAYRLEVSLSSSSGRMDVKGPDGAAFAGRVEMSSGDSRVSLGKDAAVDLTFRGSSGQFVLAVQPGQALRVEVRNISSGDVDLPDELARVSGEGKEGVWETPGYDSAAAKVNLVIENMSSGSVKVRVEG